MKEVTTRNRVRRYTMIMTMFALVAVLAIGGTIAWLTASTDPVTNTFEPGKLDVDLTETTGDEYKMVPGNPITKDPKVTVKANSEACWLFVKVEKSSNFDDFMAYEMAEGWQSLSGAEGVYYMELSATDSDTDYPVIKNDTVTVKDTVTKSMLDALTEQTMPALTFTSYACQKVGFDTASAAWAEVSK